VPALGVAIAVEILKLADATDTLEEVAAGDRIVTAALTEPLGTPRAPFATVADGKLTGVKSNVPAGLLASAFVVSTADGFHLVAADAEGVTVERQDTTSGVPEALVTFEGAAARRLGGEDLLPSALDRAETMTCVMVAAACETALRLTADYTISRKQFERPIASFQAVSQRAADSYIDTEAVRLTAWQAVWRIEHGHQASTQVATAKFWASEGGNRVTAAAHHLHGGMGVDRDYPLHRYSFLCRQLELIFGSATPSLARLGKELAAAPS
jgi:alkylation response protein AidB-like acyl-CoA dehydrogenase